MRWKRIVCAVSIISMLFSGTQAARASYEYISKDTTNVVTISNVGIKLVYESERADVVTVGQTIEQKVAIENTGKTPVYVRLKFEKYWTDQDTTDADGNVAEGVETENSKKCDVDNIFLDIQDKADWTDANWTYNEDDDCYYYKSLLPVGEKTEYLPYAYYITDGVLENTTDANGNATGTKYKSEYENAQGNVKAYGEAVQGISEEYLDDYIVFDSSTPQKVIGWKDITIDPKSIDSPEEPSDVVPPDETNVKFDEDANKFVTIHGDNLFLNMSNMLPGDTQTQKIDINNSSDETVDIYLYAEPAENDYTDEDAKKAMDDLLDMITLKVGKYNPSDDTTLPNEIYDNNLGQMSVEKGEENKILLGTFKKGDSVVLQASITLSPKWDIGNAATKIKWIFVCSKRKQNVNPPVVTSAPERSVQPPVVTEEPKMTEAPIVTPSPEVTKEPDVTDAPIITEKPATPKPVQTQPPATVQPTIAPTEPEKTLAPSPDPTQTPKTEELPTPSPIHTEITDVTITPLVPKPSKGPIGEAGLDDNTPAPIEKLPTRNPVEKQDDIKDPDGNSNFSPTPLPAPTPTPKSGKKPYTNPKTGDRNRMIFWITVFIISSGVFVVTVKDGKKRRY